MHFIAKQLLFYLQVKESGCHAEETASGLVSFLQAKWITNLLDLCVTGCMGGKLLYLDNAWSALRDGYAAVKDIAALYAKVMTAKDVKQRQESIV